MIPTPQRLESVVLVVAVGFLLAVNINLAKAGAETGTSPVALAFWMHLGAGLILLVVAAALRQPFTLKRDFLVAYVASGAVSFAFPNALGFKVAAEAGPAYGTIVYALSPLITYTIAITVGLDRLAALRTLGLLIGLIGTAIVVAARFGISQPGESRWVLLALGIPLTVALGNVLRTLFWPRGASALSLAPGSLLLASLLLGIFMIISGMKIPTDDATAGQIWIILAQIGVASLFYGLYFRLQKIAGPVYLSQIGYIGTAFGIAIALTLFGDVISVPMLAGVICIFVGVLLVSRSRSALP